MAIWVIRAGFRGEYELKFIQENHVYVTWDDLDVNVGKLSDRSVLVDGRDDGAAVSRHQGQDDQQLVEPGAAGAIS